jgi:predicted lipid-binding transport protein (Tim44 family)
MRHLFVLVLVALLMATAPALAQDGEGRRAIPITWCVCGVACFPISVILFWYFFGSFLQEYVRGQKREQTMEEIVREAPRKQQVMFKGEKVPDWKIAARQRATKAIMKFLSYTDNWFEKKYLGDVADEAFRLIKEAIEARSIQGIERRITPACLEEIRTEIKKLRKEKERHVFGRVEVTDVDVLHVETPPGKENHTFTALISAKSKDFYEDDESGDILRGDKRTYAYQEFWTFRRSEKRWLVELIRPTTDLDFVLEEKNVLAKIDLEEFGKDADPEYLKEVVAR